MEAFKRFGPRLLTLGLLALFLVVLASCTPDNPQSTFDAQGPVNRMLLDLFWVILWAAVFVFIAVEGILIYAIWRFRRRPGQEGLPPQTHGNRRLEIGWTVFPAVILAIIAVPTVIVQFAIASPPDDEEPFHIQVTGHRFWWEFRYPQQDGVPQEFLTANDMYIPAGRNVSVELLSNDVIHSFWVPKLAGKTDVVPGWNNTMWFAADEPGFFYGQCAEFCGLAHALMRFRVIAVTEEDFEDWVNLQLAPAIPPDTEAAQRGQALFTGRGACLACHAVRGTPAAGVLGPNLSRFAIRTTFAGGILDNNPENLHRWLEDPLAVKPGNVMGQFFRDQNIRFTEEEISDLIAYLESLR